MATLDEFAEVAVATLKKSMRTPTTSIADVNTFMRILKEKNKIKSSAGGTFISEPTTLVENQTIKNYYGYEAGNIGGSENLKEARFPKAQKMMHITASGREMRANMSDEKLFDFVDAKIEAGRQSAANRMNIEMYGDGSSYQSILGVQTYLQSTGGGTYGAIDSSIYTRWKNKVLEIGTFALGSATVTGDDIESGLDLLIKRCTDGEDKPTAGFLTLDWYTLLEKNYHARTRYDGLRMDPKAANVGVPSLYHAMIPMYWDVHASFAEDGEKCNLLDLNNTYLLEDPKAKWTFGKPEKPVGSDSIVIMGIWEGQLITKKRRTQGLMVPKSS